MSKNRGTYRTVEKAVYVKRRIGGGVRDEIGRVLSVDPRDQSAKVRWLHQGRVGEYKLSELQRVGR